MKIINRSITTIRSFAVCKQLFLFVASFVLILSVFSFSTVLAEDPLQSVTKTPGSAETVSVPGKFIPWENPMNVIEEADFASAPTPWSGLAKVNEFTLPYFGHAVHSWEEAETGERLIAVGHEHSPRFTLLRLIDGELTSEATYTLPGHGYAVHSWEEAETGERLIATAHHHSPRFTLLRWNGVELASEATFTLPGSGFAVHSWEEAVTGDRLVAVGHFSSPYFTLLRWDGTELIGEATYTLPGPGYAVHSWEELGTGERLIAVGNAYSPQFTLLRWNGVELTSEDAYTLPGSGRGVHSWEELGTGNRFIAVGHDNSPYFTLLRWDGASLTSKATFSLLASGRAVHSWEEIETGNRLIVVGHEGSPYSTLLRWDGEDLVGEDTYTLPGHGRGVHSWGEAETGERLIAFAHRGPPYFTLLRHALEEFGPTHRLMPAGFGFDLLSSWSVITGIEVEIVKSKANEGDDVTDDEVHLVLEEIVGYVKGSPIKEGFIQGDNRADTETQWNIEPTSVVYGSPEDTWGLSLTAEDINAGNFGVAISADALEGEARIHEIKITVYYTADKGSGTEEDPYQVSSIELLDAVRQDLSAYYVLMNDLDFCDPASYDDPDSGDIQISDLCNMPPYSPEKGWEPIGVEYEDEFTGTFDGQGHTISNLFIGTDIMMYRHIRPLGLFGRLDGGAEVSNIGLIDVDIVRSEPAGALAGLVMNASISNSYSNGRVSGGGTGGYTGGLVGGLSGGSISNSYSRARVSTGNYVGGLVGANWGGSILNSYSTGAVSGGQHLGGLIGHDDGVGTITNSFWDMDTSGRTTSAGGDGKTTEEMRDMTTYTTEGANWDIISVEAGEKNESYIWNMVDGATYPFLSWARPDSPEIRTIEDLYAVRYDRAMSYTLMNDLDFNDPTSYENPGNMENYTTGVGFLPIGGWYTPFIGGFDGKGHKISNLFIDGTDFEEDPPYGVPPVGLFGSLDTGAEISDIGLVDVNVIGENYTGALVGAIFDADILNSYSTGNINATGWGIGGLIGGIWGGLVENSYSTADTEGKFGVGGLIGEIWGDVNVSNSYATGSVSADEDTVGGLVGGNWQGDISKSYSTGAVSGTTDVGGLIGFDDGVGTISDSFWDMDTSGLTESDGGTGKTTAQMKSISTFTNTETEGLDTPWDMALLPAYAGEEWFVEDEVDYPKLGWELEVSAPLEQASGVSFPNVGTTKMTVSWVKGDGKYRIVFMKKGTGGTAIPVNGTTYIADAKFGHGSQIGDTGWYAVYKGTGTSVTVTELKQSTAYRVHVIEFNGWPENEKYLLDAASGNPNNRTTSTPSAPPPLPPPPVTEPTVVDEPVEEPVIEPVEEPIVEPIVEDPVDENDRMLEAIRKVTDDVVKPLVELVVPPEEPAPEPVIEAEKVETLKAKFLADEEERRIIEKKIPEEYLKYHEGLDEAVGAFSKAIAEKDPLSEDAEKVREWVVTSAETSLREKLEKEPLEIYLGAGRKELASSPEELIVREDIFGLLSDDDVEEMRQAVEKEGKKLVLITNDSDHSRDGVADSVKWMLGLPVFEHHPRLSDDIWKGKRPFDEWVPEVPYAVVGFWDDPFEAKFERGNDVPVRIVGDPYEEIESVVLIDVEDFDKQVQVKNEVMPVLDEEGKGIFIVDESIISELDGEYYVVVMGEEGRTGSVSKVNFVEKTEDFIFVEMLEDVGLGVIAAKGETDLGNIVLLTWQSLTYSSVVMADASAGSFIAEAPDELIPGRHIMIAAVYNPRTGAMSGVTRLMFDKLL